MYKKEENERSGGNVENFGSQVPKASIHTIEMIDIATCEVTCTTCEVTNNSSQNTNGDNMKVELFTPNMVITLSEQIWLSQPNFIQAK